MEQDFGAFMQRPVRKGQRGDGSRAPDPAAVQSAWQQFSGADPAAQRQMIQSSDMRRLLQNGFAGASGLRGQAAMTGFNDVLNRLATGGAAQPGALNSFSFGGSSMTPTGGGIGGTPQAAMLAQALRAGVGQGSSGSGYKPGGQAGVAGGGVGSVQQTDMGGAPAQNAVLGSQGASGWPQTTTPPPLTYGWPQGLNTQMYPPVPGVQRPSYATPEQQQNGYFYA